jgi:hypothetical protein
MLEESAGCYHRREKSLTQRAGFRLRMKGYLEGKWDRPSSLMRSLVVTDLCRTDGE